ncbi:MAG: DoxX family protein [Synechococcales bacterium]|nr:DoxX family protein [Synechococcales bacterium]
MSLPKYLPLVGRALLSSIFLYAGINNLITFSDTQQSIAGSGLIPPALAGPAVLGNVFCCIVGSLSLILGFKARWGAALLIIFLVPTTLLFHQFWADPGETIAFLKNLSLIGALVYVGYYGAGPVSLDARSASTDARDRDYAADPMNRPINR